MAVQVSYGVPRTIVTPLFKKNILLTLLTMDSLLSEQKHYSDDTSSPIPQKLCPYAGSYLLIRKIQMGGQACIYLAQKDNVYFALKIYNHGEVHLKAFKNQVAVLQKLDWRGLVPIEETADHVPLKLEGDEETIAHIIAMPFIENGDLFEWVSKHGRFTEQISRYFGKKLVSTLRYLNSQHVIHRDIKMENILLDEHYQPLLLDFGLSVDSRHQCHNFVGDVRYAAPEVIKHVQHTEKSEVYSLGILLFYLLTGHYPFLHARVSDPHYRLLFERKPHIFWEKVQCRIKRELSISFKELFLKMTSPNPANRPSFDQILQYSWFCESEPTREQYQRSFQKRSCPSEPAAHV